VNIKCNIEKEILNDLTKKENIVEVYKHLIKCLEALWTKNQWNLFDLKKNYQEIEKEDFRVSGVYGKTFSSPDRNHKAQFYCEMYPTWTDYYLEFLNKDNSLKHKGVS